MGKRPMAFLFLKALSRRGHRAAGPQPYSIGMMEKADHFLMNFPGHQIHSTVPLFFSPAFSADENLKS